MLVFIVLATWYRLELVSPAQKISTPVSFEIKEGEPSKKIANQLNQAGLVHSPLVFLFYVKTNAITLQAGFYSLNKNQSIISITQKIGGGKVSEYKITIPEGWRIEQIGQLLHGKKIVGYSEFIEVAKDKEGHLFPDTYRFSVEATAKDIVAKMEQNFSRRLSKANIGNLSQQDLIIASIVEREAKHDEDRPKMAGVIKNRLAIGMRLEVDPTVQYGKDSQLIANLGADGLINYEFWKAISGVDTKTIDSPYNTYRHAGLPPTPIANPGIKSIHAAVNPEKHNFYFFFNLPDGTTIYSKTREEHDANRRKYGI